MKFNISIFLIIFSLSFVSAYTYYELDLNYQKNSLNLNSWEMEISPLEKTNALGFWLAEVTSFDEEILDLIFFDTGGEIFWDGLDPETDEINYGGIDYIENFDFTLYIPYYENAKKITIYDESLNEVLEIDISMYSKKIPSDYSNELTVKNQTEDKEEEIISKEIPEKSKSFEEKIAEKWWVLGIILVILLIILIKPFSSRKNPKKHLYN